MLFVKTGLKKFMARKEVNKVAENIMEISTRLILHFSAISGKFANSRCFGPE
jgi:hypothetical protein